MDFRVGIVGAGYLTQNALAPTLHEMEGFRLAAALDIDGDAVAALTARYPVPVATTDADEFWSVPMDAVHVATPNRAHAGYACRALDIGLPTLIDKPLAGTIAEGREIAAAASHSTAPALVGYMSRRNRHNEAVIRLVRSGRIGALLAMTAVRHIRKPWGWRNLRAESGLGVLADLGIYPVLTAVELFGVQPVACRATAWPAADPHLTDVHTEATLWFSADRTLHLEASFTYHEWADVNHYTLFGEHGLVLVRDSWGMNGGGSVVVHDRCGEERIAVAGVDPYAAQYRMLAACAHGLEVPDDVSVDRGLSDLAILHSLDRSAAARGRRLSIRLPGRP